MIAIYEVQLEREAGWWGPSRTAFQPLKYVYYVNANGNEQNIPLGGNELCLIVFQIANYTIFFIRILIRKKEEKQMHL